MDALSVESHSVVAIPANLEIEIKDTLYGKKYYYSNQSVMNETAVPCLTTIEQDQDMVRSSDSTTSTFPMNLKLFRSWLKHGSISENLLRKSIEIHHRKKYQTIAMNPHQAIIVIEGELALLTQNLSQSLGHLEDPTFEEQRRIIMRRSSIFKGIKQEEQQNISKVFRASDVIDPWRWLDPTKIIIIAVTDTTFLKIPGHLYRNVSTANELSKKLKVSRLCGNFINEENEDTNWWAQQNLLDNITSKRLVSKGSWIFKQGDICDQILLLKSGHVTIKIKLSTDSVTSDTLPLSKNKQLETDKSDTRSRVVSSPQALSLSSVFNNYLFGAIETYIESKTFITSAQAATDVKLLVIERKAFQGLIRMIPSLASLIISWNDEQKRQIKLLRRKIGNVQALKNRLALSQKAMLNHLPKPPAMHLDSIMGAKKSDLKTDLSLVAIHSYDDYGTYDNDASQKQSYIQTELDDSRFKIDSVNHSLSERNLITTMNASKYLNPAVAVKQRQKMAQRLYNFRINSSYPTAKPWFQEETPNSRASQETKASMDSFSQPLTSRSQPVGSRRQDNAWLALSLTIAASANSNIHRGYKSETTAMMAKSNSYREAKWKQQEIVNRTFDPGPQRSTLRLSFLPQERLLEIQGLLKKQTMATLQGNQQAFTVRKQVDTPMSSSKTGRINPQRYNRRYMNKIDTKI